MWVEISTATSDPEEIVLCISFSLWREHSRGGERSFMPYAVALDQTDVADAAMGKGASDRQTNDAAADDGNIRVHFVVS